MSYGLTLCEYVTTWQHDTIDHMTWSGSLLTLGIAVQQEHPVGVAVVLNARVERVHAVVVEMIL